MNDRISIARRIAERLEETPDRVLMRYLARGEEETHSLTCAEIHAAGLRICTGLLAAGLGGKRVLLVMETGPEFLSALMGCLYASVIAIPCPEPRPGASLERLEGIASNSRAAAMLVSARVAADLERRAGSERQLAGLPQLLLEELAAAPVADGCPGWSAAADAPAIVQYTSGSTRSPRGVVLDSACIGANVSMASRGLDVGQNGAIDTIVNWMPHYHDMGLIGNILTPLIKGIETIHMSPLAFAQRPSRWLNAMSRYRATVSGAPAFAFALCTERVSDELIDTLDLSSWKTAFCGAEPVFAATLEAFRNRFARAGLRPRSVFTCYGLAECTLYAAGSHGPDRPEVANSSAERAPCWLDEASREAMRVVGSDRKALGDGEEGEIWLSGLSLAAGYLDDEEATEAIFRCRLDPDDGRDYLRTGDLGRIVGDRLVITGRIKDILISAGVNVAAVDIEHYATRDFPFLNSAAAAAFQGMQDAGGLTALIVERHRGVQITMDPPEVIREMRGAVLAAVGLSLDRIEIVSPGTLPRTTSGKIRRAAARDAWVESNLSSAL